MLATIAFVFQFLLTDYNYSKYIVVAITYLIALLPFSKDYMESLIEERKKERFVNNKIREIRDYLQNFFSFTIQRPIIDEYKNDEDVYKHVIIHNFSDTDSITIYSILLCFYCYLWEKTGSPELFSRIQKYADSIGISFAELTENVIRFLNFYSAFVVEIRVYKSLSEIINLQRTESEYLNLLRDFSERYLKNLAFFEIRDKLQQSENLRQTLVRLINDGELSNWGITKETLERLEKDLRKESPYSKTFLIIGNKLPKDLKVYLENQPGLTGWAPRMRNAPVEGRFSGYIIKPKEQFIDAKDMVDKIKEFANESDEMLVFVIPLDFLNSEKYIYPANQSFKSENIRKSFEAINWFKVGYEFSDADLWSIITRSKITSEELLSIIPFNIFCEGITQSEQEFFIRHYNVVKNRLGIKKLTDWRDVAPEIIVEHLLNLGKPDYNKYELKHIVSKYDNDLDLAIRKRLLDLANQIVVNSRELATSLRFYV